MLRITRNLKPASTLCRNSALFSQISSPDHLPFVFPFQSKVIDDCGVILSLKAVSTNTTRLLKDSFLPFENLSKCYRLTPMTAYPGDKLINNLIETLESTWGNVSKLAILYGIKYGMELMPKFFSWQEYYAVSEYTAVALLNLGYSDQAINLIHKITPNAFHIVGKVEPLFWSTKELLIFAYFLKGDYTQAEKIANQLIIDTQNPAIPSYQSRALTIKAIIEYAQKKYNHSLQSQEQAVELLQNTWENTNLQAVVMYDLWVLHRTLKNDQKAFEVEQTLNTLLTEIDSPLMPHITGFIKQHIDYHNLSKSNALSISSI